MDRAVLVELPLGEQRESAAGASREVAVARTRSVACGAQCQARACTVREMTAARQLADDPKLTLWIELLVVAHLVGEPEPLPDSAWLDGLRRSAPARVLECAAAHRIQAAIDSRYTGLAADYQPEALARHVAAAVARRLHGEAGRCDGSEVEWQAGRFRWVDVVRALERGTGDRARPHPDSDAWARRGLALPGSTEDEQLANLRRHPSAWLPSYRTILGTEVPPTFDRAAIRLSNAADPVDRLQEALGFLSFNGPWPAARLLPAHWRARHGPADA